MNVINLVLSIFVFIVHNKYFANFCTIVSLVISAANFALSIFIGCKRNLKKCSSDTNGTYQEEDSSEDLYDGEIQNIPTQSTIPESKKSTSSPKPKE